MKHHDIKCVSEEKGFKIFLDGELICHGWFPEEKLISFFNYKKSLLDKWHKMSWIKRILFYSNNPVIYLNQ